MGPLVIVDPTLDVAAGGAGVVELAPVMVGAAVELLDVDPDPEDPWVLEAEAVL